MLDAKIFSQWNKTKHEPEGRWFSATNLWFRPYFRTPKTHKELPNWQGKARSEQRLIPWGANCLTDSVHISTNSKLSKLMNQWTSFKANRNIQISSFLLWIIINSLNDLKCSPDHPMTVAKSGHYRPLATQECCRQWSLAPPPLGICQRRQRCRQRLPWGISHWEMVISPGKPEENHRKLWENHGDLKNDGLSVDWCYLMNCEDIYLYIG